ncbi:NAD(P)/FAD-dependent oxidoreductase [Intestinibacillus sp. Marseille-P6563]|uniref:NAD(P)/FAD-dependent oxidoreductase n=1 Tax=Intestinibacillus sp. Marseille-P6563 TaxID=2364792 RepID=UPI000F06B585|nr:NAD(P)/FAD-dependent oxidoreductase [Intestinibacillus sp. Marseille-P6563]
MSNVIIVGGGPAGISAALYTVRAGLDTTIIYNGVGALAKAHAIENYYGFALPVSGEALAMSGLEQARRLGARIIQDEITGIGFDEQLTLTGAAGQYAADFVILATGSPRTAPRIPGLSEHEGKGVSYCAVCDAFFHRGKPVAVLGEGEYALHEVNTLLPVVRSVTLVTDGKTPSIQVPESVRLDTREIAAIESDDSGLRIRFTSGGILSVSGIFVAYGVAGSAELARKVGALTEGNRILVDPTMATNIPGLYAAGDCTGGMLQVAKAVYEGALAGTAVVKAARGK